MNLHDNFWFILMLLLMTGCQTQAPSNNQQRPITQKATPSTDAEYWYNLASSANFPKKNQFLLKGIAISLNQSDLSQLAKHLQQLTSDQLDPEQQFQFQLYSAILLTYLGDFRSSLYQFSLLENHPFTIDNRKLLYVWHAQAYLLSSNYLEAVNKRIQLSQYLTADQSIANQNVIWRILKLPTEKYLMLFSEDLTLDQTMRGWLELALVEHRFQGKPRLFIKNLSLWKNRFPTHPANQQIPTELTALSEAKLFSPKQIAILLPQTGPIAPSAEIIRQGIEAAFFQNPVAQKPQLHFYNSNVKNIRSTYQKALDDGADFILGPLQKNNIELLKQLPSKQLPTLTLNIVPDQVEIQLNTNSQPPSQPQEQTQPQTETPVVSENTTQLDPQNFLYQFGLPIENETKQIAEKLEQSDVQQVAVIVPDNHIGDRALTSFKKHFEAVGGKIVIQRHYQENKKNSDVIQSLLGVDQSIKRNKKFERLFGRKLKFEARRRQDIEAIFLYANPQNGRRLKPLLNYYFATDIPVYSTSKIYSGEKNAHLDKDLEGIQFINYPWLESKPTENSSIRSWKEMIPNSLSAKHSYLFAFGVDSYQLIDQVGILQMFPSQYLEGLTGKLSMNSSKQITNTLNWNHFHNGLPQFSVQAPRTKQQNSVNNETALEK